jgi:hypothetical protein
VNKKNKLFAGAAVALLLVTAGLAWAYTPNKIYNRPDPLMDYVPQEIAIGDYLYPSLGENDCRFCHGNSLADRHHYSEIALSQGLCTPCHEITTTPPYVTVTRDCTTSGCHSTADLGPLDASAAPPNGWHHYTQESYVDQCIACHDPGVLDRVVDDDAVPFAMYPPSVVTPTPFSCEDCHWEQPVIANTIGWQNGDPQSTNPYAVANMAGAGHPSTFDHNDPYTAYSMDGSTAGNWNDYYEYGKKIESNFDTHHMLFTGNVSTDCERCHSVDPDDPSWNPGNPELIRYCETCHDIATLHAIEPHVGTGGTADVPAVNGWEAVGFHVPDTSNTNTADVAPTTYRNFTSNQQCYGCHGNDLPEWLPEAPVAQPTITDIEPQLVACDGYVTLTGNHFGEVKTSQRSVQMAPSGTMTYTEMPILSWTSTQIEFQIPCWVYATGNYKIVVDTETGPPSNVVPLVLTSGATVTNLSPNTGLCREIVTVNGSDFGGARDYVQGGTNSGAIRVVQVVASSGTYQATVYGSWSATSFQFRFGDFFEDSNGNFVRDGEPLLKQCEDLALGTYSVYVRTIFYEDDGSGFFDAADTINQITISDPVYFTLEDGLALYAVFPSQIERSHYCESVGIDGNENNICEGGETCYAQNGIAKIYGFGFGPSQDDGKVFIGTGGMYNTDTGLELHRVVWSSLLIKAAIDVPGGAKGLPLYLWVSKGGQKTDATYGYPVITIKTTEHCNGVLLP